VCPVEEEIKQHEAQNKAPPGLGLMKEGKMPVDINV
jgi:hypothetical protein